ncbi:Protein nessun dorma [Pseudolycoriella hygida]|uniref:Protein nessun dorma n=1 Tax=Pseudolycoriella hygida TaxID=35572 RepID=A0A9Q0NHN9_9DIPT|nr:Protein nessun dorma [Pseudolycoriella hygida]
MEVIQFDKSLMDRLKEAQNVLITDKRIPASRVIEEWGYHVELLIEPAGWQAIWKISRVICEELKIKYPTTVYGTVTNVLFKELKAIFSISAIQDDEIHLPEEHEVPLIDLWPTIAQENPAINIETTANCVDMIRFFFNNLWMPWDVDNDEDVDWPSKYLESRIRFSYDLKANMSSQLASHIRALLVEAQYIQRRREYLELDISDDEDLNEIKSDVADLMILHVRLTNIKHEIEMWENPKLRSVFEPLRFPPLSEGAISVVIQDAAALSKHIQDLEKVREIVADEPVRLNNSLQECLMKCGASGSIYLGGGLHSIKFNENMDNSIIGLVPCDNSMELRLAEDVANSKQSVILAKDYENVLLTLNGNVKFKNVVFDCRRVRIGILVRSGSAHFENCTFIGDNTSNTSTGILMMEHTTVSIENCVVKDFSTGISARGYSCGSWKNSVGYSLLVNNSIIAAISTGIECSEYSSATFKDSKIVNAKHYGILATSQNITESKLLLSAIDQMKKYNMLLEGNCKFTNCLPNNIAIFNKKNGETKRMTSIDVDGMEDSGCTEHNKSLVSEEDCSLIVIDD